MSETISDVPDAPQAPPAPPIYDAVWQSKLIAEQDFAGRVISRKTAAERFGSFDPDAPIVIRIQRILDMSPYIRGLPGAAGIWIDAVLKRIKAAAFAAGNASERYSIEARMELRATYEGLVIQTEKTLEAMIRAHLTDASKEFENLSAAAAFSVGGGSYPQPSRRQIHEAAPKFSAAQFVTRLRAAGIYPRRDDATGGLAWAGGSALSFADREVLQDRILEIALFLNGRPDLCSPPPPPPPPMVQSEEEPAEVEAIPVADAGPIAPVQAEDIEPAEVVVQHADVAVEVQQTAEPITADQNERMANPSAPATPTTAESKKRRHRYAHISTLRNS